MKILISTDIEGVAGVVDPEQTRAGNAEYEQARRWMAEEANAAIAGAFAVVRVWCMSMIPMRVFAICAPATLTNARP